MQTNHHVGRITNEFKLTHIGQKGTAKIGLCLAVPTTRNGKKETDFIFYQAYSKTAELLNQYANVKGIQLEVVFTMRSRKYTDANGVEKHITENVISEFQVLDSKQQRQNTLNNRAPETEVANHSGNNMQGDNLFTPEPPLDYFGNTSVEDQPNGGTYFNE